jgi:non-ribosomal peptide synthetase component F
LPFLSAGDAALVAAWGDGGPGVAATGSSVAADVAAVAARTPEAVAIVAGGERWTYARLNTAAGRVAAALRASRVGRESRVGIIGTRSPGMIATSSA